VHPIGPLEILANTAGIEYKLKINAAIKNDATTRITGLIGTGMGVYVFLIRIFGKSD